MYLEPFHLAVIANKALQGHILNGVEVKVSADADDAAVFYSDEESVMETFVLTNKFCNTTGATVWWGKCCGVWHGRYILKPQCFVGIS